MKDIIQENNKKQEELKEAATHEGLCEKCYNMRNR